MNNINTVPTPQNDPSAPTPLSLKEKKATLIDEASRLRKDIAEVEKQNDGNPEVQAQVEGKLRALRRLLNENEMELDKITSRMLEEPARQEDKQDKDKKYSVNTSPWTDDRTGGNSRGAR